MANPQALSGPHSQFVKSSWYNLWWRFLSLRKVIALVTSLCYQDTTTAMWSTQAHASSKVIGARSAFISFPMSIVSMSTGVYRTVLERASWEHLYFPFWFIRKSSPRILLYAGVPPSDLSQHSPATRPTSTLSEMAFPQ